MDCVTVACPGILKKNNGEATEDWDHTKTFLHLFLMTLNKYSCQLFRTFK